MKTPIQILLVIVGSAIIFSCYQHKPELDRLEQKIERLEMESKSEPEPIHVEHDSVVVWRNGQAYDWHFKTGDMSKAVVHPFDAGGTWTVTKVEIQ